MPVASPGDDIDAALGRVAKAATGARVPPKESLSCLICSWEEPESLVKGGVLNSSK